MTKLDLMALSIAFLILAAAWIGEKATKNPDNKFDFSEMFVGQGGKNSMTNFGKFVALVISSWAVVAIVVTEQSDALIEFVLGAYLAAWVTDSVANHFAQRKQNADNSISDK